MDSTKNLRVSSSDYLMFPHMTERFVNEEGNDITSHMILLPPETEEDQLSVELSGNSKIFNLHYAYPRTMMQKETIALACNMHDNCAKVTVFQKLFSTMKSNSIRHQRSQRWRLIFRLNVKMNPSLMKLIILQNPLTLIVIRIFYIF